MENYHDVDGPVEIRLYFPEYIILFNRIVLKEEVIDAVKLSLEMAAKNDSYKENIIKNFGEDILQKEPYNLIIEANKDDKIRKAYDKLIEEMPETHYKKLGELKIIGDHGEEQYHYDEDIMYWKFLPYTPYYTYWLNVNSFSDALLLVFAFFATIGAIAEILNLLIFFIRS